MSKKNRDSSEDDIFYRPRKAIRRLSRNMEEFEDLAWDFFWG